MYFLSLCHGKSSFCFLLLLSPSQSWNTSLKRMPRAHKTNYSGVLNMKVCFNLNLLLHIPGCVFVFLLFLPFPLHFLPLLPCLLPWFHLSFLLPPKDIWGYQKEEKKSDIYKGIHHYLDIIFRGIGKALGTESDSSWDALNWNLLSQAWKGVALPSKLFQDQTQSTAHFVQLIPFTEIISPPQEFLKYFTFYLYGNGDFHMKKRLFRI